MSKRRLFVMLLFFLCYSLSVVPYIIHSNSEKAGIYMVSAVREIGIDEIPEDVRSIFGEEESEKITVYLIENPISQEKNVMLSASSHSFVKDDVVEIYDTVTEWFVDWHAYDFFGESFSKLIIGSAHRVSDFEAYVERMLASPIGAVIYEISKFSFFISPLLLAFYISEFRLRLWTIPLILSIYAAEVMVSNIIAQLHGVMADDLSRYFGYSFIILAFLSAVLRKRGDVDIKDLYEIISSALSKFSR